MNSSPKDYDLNNPSVLYLNEVMAEISGIYFYQKDSSVFAISDESGYLFKIHLNKNIYNTKDGSLIKRVTLKILFTGTMLFIF